MEILDSKNITWKNWKIIKDLNYKIADEFNMGDVKISGVGNVVVHIND